ncbi:MAG: RluA family pseudouridine synthase [Acholeplasmatales bacterium]|nr:RluA family pseudouridine synthase [Acholeplasmatales bacterium]
MKIEFIVKNDNVRLSEELKSHLSRRLYKHIKGYKCEIYVNGNICETYKIVNKGDNVSVLYIKPNDIKWDLYESKLNIIYEDKHYLIVYKNKDLLTIPTKINPKSLYQEVLYYLKSTNQELNVSILNRLDKETRGLVMVAKDTISASLMQPTHEKMERRYLALCHGIFDDKTGRIENRIRRSDDSNKRIISDDGQIAITNYKVIKEYDNYSLVEFILETGRTHQIRLHTSSINHPILGDKLYGIDDNIEDLKLLSYYIMYTDPYDSSSKIFNCENDLL